MMEYYDTSEEEEQPRASHGPITKFSYLYPTSKTKTSQQSFSGSKTSFGSADGSISRKSSSEVEHTYSNIDYCGQYKQSWSPRTNNSDSYQSDTSYGTQNNIKGVSYIHSYNNYCKSYKTVDARTLRKDHRPHLKGWRYSTSPIMFSECTYEERQEERQNRKQPRQQKVQHYNGDDFYYQNQRENMSSQSPVRSFTNESRCDEEIYENVYEDHVYSTPRSNYRVKSPIERVKTPIERATSPIERAASPIYRSKSPQDFYRRKITDHKSGSSSERPKSGIINKHGSTYDPDYITNRSSWHASTNTSTDRSAYRNLSSPVNAKILRHSSPSPTLYRTSRSRTMSPTNQEKQRISPVEFQSRRSRFEQYTDSVKRYNGGVSSPTPSRSYSEINVSTNRYSSDSKNQKYVGKKSVHSAFSPVQNGTHQHRSASQPRHKSQEEIIRTANQQYQEYLRSYSSKHEAKSKADREVHTVMANGRHGVESPSLRGSMSPVESNVKRSTSFDEYYDQPKVRSSVSSMVNKFQKMEDEELLSWYDYLGRYYQKKLNLRKEKSSSEQNLPQASSLGKSQKRNFQSSTSLNTNSINRQEFRRVSPVPPCRSPAISTGNIISNAAPGYLSPTCVQSLGSTQGCAHHKHSFSSTHKVESRQHIDASNEVHSIQYTKPLSPSPRPNDCSDLQWAYIGPEESHYMTTAGISESKNISHAPINNQNPRINRYNNSSKTEYLNKNSSTYSQSLTATNATARNHKMQESVTNSTILDKSSERKSRLNMSRAESSRTRSQSADTYNLQRRTGTTSYRIRMMSPPPALHFVRMTSEAKKKSEAYEINPDQRLLNLLFGKGEDERDRSYYDSQIKQKQEVVQQSKFIQDGYKSHALNSTQRNDLQYASQNHINDISKFNTTSANRNNTKIVSPCNFESTSLLTSTSRAFSSSTDLNSSTAQHFVTRSHSPQVITTNQYKQEGSHSGGSQYQSNVNDCQLTKQVITTGNEYITQPETGECWTYADNPSTYVARTYYVANSQMPTTPAPVQQRNSSHINKMEGTSLYREFSCLSPKTVTTETGVYMVSKNNGTEYRRSPAFNNVNYKNSYVTSSESQSNQMTHKLDVTQNNIPGYRPINFNTNKVSCSPVPSNYSSGTNHINSSYLQAEEFDSVNTGYSSGNSGNTVVNMQTIAGKATDSDSSATTSVLKFTVNKGAGSSEIEERKRQYFQSLENDSYFPLKSHVVAPRPQARSQKQRI